MGSAVANFCEDDRGSITVGKLADLVVLDQDPHTVDPAKLADVAVLETWVGGERVYAS